MRTILKPLITAGIAICMVSGCQKSVDQITSENNNPPVLDAGAALTITKPVDNVTLNGSATDADGTVEAYVWSQVSGPGTANIAYTGSATTAVTNFQAGTYLFQLLATDNDGATGVDTMSVTVNPGLTTDTLNLRPSNNPYEFQLGIYDGADYSGSGTPEISLATWTISSLPVTLRKLVKFDLSTIPSSATIQSATLSLYSTPNPLTGNMVDANYGTDNSFVIQQVTSDWSPSTTNWFNQPSVAANGQMVIPSTTLSFLDLNVDVTNMVQSMVITQYQLWFLLQT